MERRRASSPSRRKYRLLLRVYAAENLRHVASQGTFCRVTIEEGETPMRGSARASLKRLLQGSARANALDSSDDPLASSLPPRIVTTQVQKSLHGKPIWNEKFELPVVDVSHEVVHFRIKSARVMSAPIIGGASVMLSDVPTDATMDRWLNLFDSSRKPAGKLRIQMRLSLMSSSTSSSSPRSFPASAPSPVLRPRSSTASAMGTTTTTDERDTYYQHPRRTSYVSPTALPRSNRRGAIIAPPIGGVATFRRSSTLSRSMLEMRASGSTTASDSISSDHSHPNDSVVTPYTPSFNDSFVETPTASSSPLTNKQRDPPTPTRTPPARSAPAYSRDSDVSFASSRFTGLSDRGRSTASAAVRDTDVSRVSSRFTGLSDRGRSTPSAAVRDTDASRASSRFTGYSGHDRSTTAFSTSSRDTELDDLANKYMIKPTRETTINPVPEEPEASRRSSRAASASRDDSYASLKASFTMPKAVPDSMAMPESAWESSWETPSPVGRASSMVFGESEKESPDTWELTQPGRKKSTAVAPSTANPDTGNTWEWETLSPRWSSDTVPSPIEKPVRQNPSAVHGASKKSMPVPVPVPVPVVAPPVPMVAPSVPVPVSISASLSVPSARVSKPNASRGSAEETPSPRVAKPSASQETPATRELSRREQRTSQQIMPNELEDFLHGEDPVVSGRGQPVSTASSPSSSSSPSGPSLSDIKRHVGSSKKVVAPDSKTSSSSQAGAGANATTNNSPSPKDERSPRTTNTTARGSNEDGEDLGETIEFDFDTGDVRPSKRLPSHMMRSTMSRSSIASSRMMSDGDESGIDHDDDGYDSDDSEDEPEDDEMDPDGDPDGPRMVLRSTVTWLLGRDSVNVIMDVDEEDEDYDDFDPFVFDDFPLLDMNDTTFLIKDIDYADRTAAAS